MKLRLPLALLALMGTASFAFTGEDLFRLSREVDSIEELLERLPPDIQRRALLGWDTLSNQYASFKAPRNFLFTADGKLMMTFTGHPEGKGGNIIEMYEFDDTDKVFKFREINFDPGIQKTLRVSEVNPRRCVACHARGGDDTARSMRPNWDGYHVWRRFYGSNDDDFTNRHGLNELTIPAEEERAALADFLENHANEGRYRFLPNLRERFSTDDTSAFKGTRKIRPNLEFNDAVQKLNRERVMEPFLRSPNYEKLRPFLAGMYIYRGTSFLKKLGFEDFQRKVFEEGARWRGKDLGADFLTSLEGLCRALGFSVLGDDPVTSSSMTFRPSDDQFLLSQFSTGRGVMEPLLEFLDVIKERDPKFAKLVKHPPYEDMEGLKKYMENFSNYLRKEVGKVLASEGTTKPTCVDPLKEVLRTRL